MPMLLQGLILIAFAVVLFSYGLKSPCWFHRLAGGFKWQNSMVFLARLKGISGEARRSGWAVWNFMSYQ